MQYKRRVNNSNSNSITSNNITISHLLSLVIVRNILLKFLRSQDQGRPVKRGPKSSRPMMRTITWKLN